ncbi:MAG: nuclear transport factor 2 family protein [Candidatus Bathyarchaeota archaeon]|nr:nuclear transport factor 2 family protein [Candidatus Bathyarchaeota archaeon]
MALGLVMLAVVALAYVTLIQPRAQKPMTEKEKDVDRFIMTYYGAMSNKSVPRVVALFTEDAVLIDSNGNVYRGRSLMERYYETLLRDIQGYSVKAEASEIKFEGQSAEATYHSKSTYFTFGDTLRPVEAFLDKFTLVRQDGSWKIAALEIKREWIE